MSNTYKDAPLWVRINRERINNTDHDHLDVGKDVYKFVQVLDENGDPVKVNVVEYIRADEVGFDNSLMWFTTITGRRVNELGITFHYMRNTVDRPIPKVRQDVQYALAHGKGHWRIPVSDTVITKMEWVLDYTYKDYCTAGEPLTRAQSPWNSDMPCTPDVVQSFREFYFRGATAKRAAAIHKHNRKNRTAKRNTLSQAVKGYNSGTDIEEYEDSFLPLTNQNRSSIAWDMW